MNQTVDLEGEMVRDGTDLGRFLFVVTPVSQGVVFVVGIMLSQCMELVLFLQGGVCDLT